MIAEAGVNHNGSPALAHKLIDVAVEAGADAIKFQTFNAGRLVTHNAPKAAYQRQTTDEAESQYEMLRRLELDSSAHRSLKERCDQRGIVFLSTPFDEESADFLDDLGVTAFKISSGEVTNIPFLQHLARKKKPMILSTGMATLEEVKKSVTAVREAGGRDLVLLHCVSAYPAEPRDVNLRAMSTLESEFGVPVGFSDHTLGIEVAIGAVAVGAAVIEKHFTVDRNLPGPDHKASIEPPELAALVRGIRKVEAALGDGTKVPAASEAETAVVARKSLVAAVDIRAGTVLNERLISIMRPGTGLAPGMRPQLIGRKVNVDVPAGTLFSLEMLV